MEKIYKTWLQRFLLYGSIYGIFFLLLFFLDVKGAWSWAAFAILLCHKMFLKNII
jgi:hypothetical protein